VNTILDNTWLVLSILGGFFGVLSAGAVLAYRAVRGIERVNSALFGLPAIGGTPALPGLVGQVARHEERLDQVEATVRNHLGPVKPA